MVFFAAPPQILAGPVDTIVNVQENATFTCFAYAYPAPLIEWYKQLQNGSLQLLTDTSKYSTTTLSTGLLNSTSQLIVLDTRVSVSGEMYMCRATSGFSSITSDAGTLTVLSEFDISIFASKFYLFSYRELQ